MVKIQSSCLFRNNTSFFRQGPPLHEGIPPESGETTDGCYIEDNAISGKSSRKRWGEDDLLML